MLYSTTRLPFLKTALSALVLGLSALVSAQSATTLYATGFEVPQFLSGTLDGQKSFRAFAGQYREAATVSDQFPSTGTQSVRLNSALLNTGFYAPVLDYDPLTSGSPIVVARTDIAFVPSGLSFCEVGHRLYNTEGALLASLTIDQEALLTASNGTDDGYDFSASALGTYHTLTTRADFARRTLYYFADGSFLSAQTISEANRPDLASVELYMSADPLSEHIAYADNYSVTAVPENASVLLTGRVFLEASETTAAGVQAHFEFRTPSGVSFTRTEMLTAQGTFTIDGVPPGTYQVAIKTPRNLQKVLSVAAEGPYVAGLEVSLPGGDANNDNSVDALDLALLIDAFNSVPEDTDYWNPAADFNDDHSIDALDLAILIDNFNLEGDP